MSRSVAIVAAHPDDEVLGCGGTAAFHCLAGDVVSVLILAEGVTSRGQQRARSSRNNELDALAQAAYSANAALGVSRVTLHDFPDNRMDSVDLLDIVKVVEAFLEACSPSTVYTHSSNDLNVDHRATHEAVLTACRPLPSCPVKSLLFFEVPSSTEWRSGGDGRCFSPSWYVDISATLQRKLDALNAYGMEMRPFPHPRSLQAVEALARWRGSSIGVSAAEAFVVGRHVLAPEEL
jgi:LmbE family N-acetylglucosaminyl deacetylase